jgi:hypothetical protein
VLLDKAEEFVKSGAATEEELLNSSIHPDMYPLKRQIQIISDTSRGTLARLSGKDRVAMEDTETTIVELRERITATIDIVNTFKPDDFANADTVKVTLPWMGNTFVSGKDFVEQFAITNMLFHVVTAYNILRMKGVQVRKQDYINGLSIQAIEGEE